MDLSFIWRILTFSVGSKSLELNFSLVMLQILSCLYDIFVLSYALLELHRHQIPCQVVREGFLRTLALNSTTAFPDYRAWLNFTALKFIFISCSFFPMDCYLLSSIFIWAWMTVCHCLMVFLLSHSLLSAVCSFQGLSFYWTWTATVFTYPCLMFWLGPFEILSSQNFWLWLLFHYHLSSFFSAFDVFPRLCLSLCIQASYLNLPCRGIV